MLMEVLCILRRTPGWVHATLLLTILQIKWCDTCVFRIRSGTVSTAVHQVRQLGARRGVGHDGKSQSASAARWAEKVGCAGRAVSAAIVRCNGPP
jgi:hypothetical protein